MSDQVQEELDWDAVLGSIDKEEKDKKKDGKSDFESLPAGPYEVVVQSATKQVASTGSDMIKTQVQVQGGPYNNRVLFSYIVFAKGSPTAMRMTLEKLAAFGLTREFIATSKPSIPAIAEMLEGRKAIAVVGIQESGQYKGSNEIKRFKPLDGATQPAPEAPAATEAKPGVPVIPTPAAEAPAVAAPVIPTPDVPGAPSDDDVFGDG